MKTLQNLILIALLSTFTLTSCQKDEIPGSKVEEREISTKQMQNGKNPYDEQGVLHNAFLDHFIAKADGKKEMNPDKMLSIYASFYAANKMEFGDEQIAGYQKLFNAYGELKIGRPVPPFPLNFCRLFPAICDILTPSPTFPFALPTGLLNGQNGDSSTERTLKFIEAVKMTEANILADKELSEDHKKVLLNQHAIARYSAGYWHNVSAIQKGKSGYYDDFQDADIAALCHVCDVVGADAAGAAVGALVGGVGAGPGAGIASGAAVLEKAWNWFWN
ncbi:hypothetical protein [Sphingobacterium pedocola]|uniref:hypothetical protein n=1 Tax=Sphingobacterium pedocola TaxID=2082722 RepID=UPI0018C9D967|nr:hypothetical protein [Sphingobacterium pedocola]